MPWDNPDGDVLALFSRGDRHAALRVLMERYEERVYSFCYSLIRDRELAEDVLQQTFIEAFHNFEKFEGRSSLLTWLLGIARYRSLDAIRSQKRLLKHRAEYEATVIPVPDPSPDQRLDDAHMANALIMCLSKLEARTRETVILRYVEELGWEEIAGLCGENADRLRMRAARALPLLRRCLDAQFGDSNE